MQNQNRFLLLAAILLITTLVGCKPAYMSLETYFDKEAKTLVTIDTNKVVLTDRQLFAELWASDAWPNGVTLDTASLSLLVDSIIMDSVVGLVADRDLNLREYFPQYWGYRSRYEEALLGAYYKEYVYSQIDIDSQAVIDHLAANAESMSLPEQVFFFHILVSPKWFATGPEAKTYKGMSDEELTRIIAAYAADLYQALQNGEPFDEVARQFSHDKNTRREGGVVGWAPRERYRAPFDSIAFTAEFGVAQPPYQDEDGWHIILVGDRIAGGPVPLDRPEFYGKVAADLMSKLSGEISGKIMDSLRDFTTIEFVEDVLEMDVFRSDEKIIAAVINNVDTIRFMDIRTYELDYRRAYGIRSSTPDIKKLIIGRLAGKYAVLQAARADGMDTTAAMIQMDYALLHESCRTIVMAQRFDPGWRPTASMINAYYEMHKTDFIIEKPIRIQRLLVQDSLLAAFVRDQAASGIDLEELAEAYVSEAPKELLKSTQISETDVEIKLWHKLNQMPVGSISKLIPTPEGGYMIVKLVDRMVSRNLTHAHGDITTILTQKYMKDSIDKFRQDGQVRFNIQRSAPLTPMHLRSLNARYNTVL